MTRICTAYIIQSVRIRVIRVIRVLLPFHRVRQDIPIRRILGRERISPILHAQHHQRFRPVVAHRATTLGSHTHHAPFLDRENLAIDLELTLARQKKIQLLVILVRMEETRFRSWLEKLEGKLAARSLQSSPAEYLPRDFHLWPQFQYILTQFIQFAHINRTEILSFRYILNLFHRIYHFIVYYF